MALVAALLQPSPGSRRRPRVLLMRSPEPAGGSRDPRQAPRALRPDGGVRLLIVDDDPLMTELLPRKLARAMAGDVRILTASNVGEAERLIATERPHIVLSDFNLREARTGLDVLARAAREVPEAARILFSGHTPAEMGRPLSGADIHGYIEKPMKLDELVASLLAAIHGATGLDLARGSADGTS